MGDSFYHGITNGAGWYHLAGGMQDWQYLNSNSMEITVEQGCFKFPFDSMYPTLWNEHKFSLISYMEMVHRGVKGIVTDAQGNPLGNATIRIADGSVTGGKNITTTSLGEYWRLLSPGKYKLEVIHADHQPYQFEIDIDNGPVKIFNITMKDVPCNSDDNQQILIRGSGSVKLALLALDTDSGDLLKQVANSTCPTTDPLLKMLLNHGKLGFFPAYNQLHDLQPLKTFSPDAIILLSTGAAHSVIYNKGEFTPKLFNASAFDESVKRAFVASGGPNSSCPSKLDETNISLMVDNMEISDRFQLGIAIGCQPKNDSKRAEAAITGIIESLLNVVKKDVVQEFSVIPSANPSDHFTPDQVLMSTSAGLDRIIDSSTACNLRQLEVNGMKVYQTGAQKGPRTLVMAVEADTVFWDLLDVTYPGTSKNIKPSFAAPISTFQDQFEFPRQQNQNNQYPMVMQFQASQKLSRPGQNGKRENKRQEATSEIRQNERPQQQHPEEGATLRQQPPVITVEQQQPQNAAWADQTFQQPAPNAEGEPPFRNVAPPNNQMPASPQIPAALGIQPPPEYYHIMGQLCAPYNNLLSTFSNTFQAFGNNNGKN